MDSQVLPGRWGGLSGETEVIPTKQPNAAALTVVSRIRNPQLMGLKPLPTAVTTGLNHCGLRANAVRSKLLHIVFSMDQITHK